MPKKYRTEMDRVKKNKLKKALFEAEGDISKASKELGITRQTIYNWIKEYDLVEFLVNERDIRRNGIPEESSDDFEEIDSSEMDSEDENEEEYDDEEGEYEEE